MNPANDQRPETNATKFFFSIIGIFHISFELQLPNVRHLLCYKLHPSQLFLDQLLMNSYGR